MTLQEFAPIMAVLAMQLRATDVDEATIRAYYEALKDLPLALVAGAARTMALEADWFPRTSEWRLAADAERLRRRRVFEDRLRALHDRGLVLCDVCLDEGWTRHEERGSGYSYVRRCGCQQDRKLEILGSRPLPRLLAGEVADALTQSRDPKQHAHTSDGGSHPRRSFGHESDQARRRVS